MEGCVTTRKETQDILMVIQAAYPNFRVPDKTIAVNAWESVLNDFTYSQVSAAVTAYIRSDTSGFAPAIGQIVEQLERLFGTEDIPENEAWMIVLKAIRNSTYNSDVEFEKLPFSIQRVVSTPSQLHEWAISEVNDNTISGWKRDFTAAYRKELNHEKEYRKLSPELRKIASRSGNYKNLEMKGGI